jgi:transcriptional regulator with XRE-family HTH domain
VPRDAGNRLDLGHPFGGNPVPFHDGGAGEPEAVSDLGEHSTLRSDRLHSVLHERVLTRGKRLLQAKCFPQVGAPSCTHVLMEIGHRIRKARDLAGLSQTQLAKAAGVSRGLVGQWESHKKSPGRETLMRIAKAATVSAGYLLGEEPLEAISITTVKLEEVALLRKFRQLTPVQQKNLLQLIDASVEIRQDIDQQRRPAKREKVA